MKKQDKEVLTILVIIILVIVFMAVLLGVLAKPNEPHFKITKEECRNETWREFLCANGESGNLTDNNFWKIRDTLENCYVLTSYPFCEQVEVEKLPYNNYSWVYADYGLTIEWLDENCECEEWEKLEESKFICFDGEGDYYPCGECSKYKCEFDETYFVETWNQIK